MLFFGLRFVIKLYHTAKAFVYCEVACNSTLEAKRKQLNELKLTYSRSHRFAFFFSRTAAAAAAAIAVGFILHQSSLSRCEKCYLSTVCIIFSTFNALPHKVNLLYCAFECIWRTFLQHRCGNFFTSLCRPSKKNTLTFDVDILLTNCRINMCRNTYLLDIPSFQFFIPSLNSFRLWLSRVQFIQRLSIYSYVHGYITNQPTKRAILPRSVFQFDFSMLFCKIDEWNDVQSATFHLN